MKMCSSLLPCPLCTLPRFDNLESLRIGLIKVATENLICPVCHDIFMGLDKLTIHLFSHCKNDLAQETGKKVIIEDGTENVKSLNESLEREEKKQAVHNETDKRKGKTKNSNRNGNETNNDLPNHPGSFFNINTIPFIGIPEKMTMLQKKKNPTDKKKCRNNKLSEKCDICGFYFLGKNIVEMHKKLIHNVQNSEIINGVSKYSCHLCPKVFKMRGSLMVHLRMVHFGIIPSVEENPSRESLNISDNISPVFCKKELSLKCDDTRDNSSGVTDFEILIANTASEIQDQSNSNGVNNASKHWTCDICKKQFTTKYFLKKHKRLHTGEMPYACAQCNKTFTFQQSYHKHLLYHNDDKPHQCTHCGRAFKELSTLHNHQRIHTGEKPFSCETCGKCFRQRVSYLVHRRIHTGAMPYKCTSCDKSFRYKVSQRTHKCTAQPPGVLVRQSGDLVQKLIQNQKELQNVENQNEKVCKESKEPGGKGKSFSKYSLESNHDFIRVQDIQFVENLSDGDRQLNSDRNQIQENNIIDELVNESILKINFGNPPSSTSILHNFSSDVTDLYSMISPQHNIEEDLPSPSDRFRNLKLSPLSENILEKDTDFYEKSKIYSSCENFDSNSADSFIKNKNDFHPQIFQGR